MVESAGGAAGDALLRPATQAPSTKRGQQTLRVVRVASGNFLENYDLTIYGYYAAAIGLAYFPASS